MYVIQEPVKTFQILVPIFQPQVMRCLPQRGKQWAPPVSWQYWAAGGRAAGGTLGHRWQGMGWRSPSHTWRKIWVLWFILLWPLAFLLTCCICLPFFAQKSESGPKVRKYFFRSGAPMVQSLRPRVAVARGRGHSHWRAFRGVRGPEARNFGPGMHCHSATRIKATNHDLVACQWGCDVAQWWCGLQFAAREWIDFRDTEHPLWDRSPRAWWTADWMQSCFGRQILEKMRGTLMTELVEIVGFKFWPQHFCWDVGPSRPSLQQGLAGCSPEDDHRGWCVPLGPESEVSHFFHKIGHQRGEIFVLHFGHVHF